MQRHGLAGPAALQAELNGHLAQVLARLGRRTVAWDEVLHPRLPAAVTVQAWRGVTARDRAVAAGHDCVLSAPYYLDLFYPADVHYGFDPAAPLDELLALEDALPNDPRFAHVAGGMAWTRHWRDDKADHVAAVGAGRLLGAEACLWTELVDARLLDLRLWSRMPALAERFWSPAACRDTDDMYQRLDIVLERLARWAGVDVPGDYRRLTAQAGVNEAWRTLTDVLEPVKWYGRLLGEEALTARLRGREMPLARPYDADTGLDRVVDALPPESAAARRLASLCRAERAGDAGARGALRNLAQTWQRLPPGGGPAELEEPADRLRQLGATVQGVLAGTLVVEEALQHLARAAEPIGEYLLAPVPVLIGWLEERARAAPAGGGHG
jgi:hexosaminidase